MLHWGQCHQWKGRDEGTHQLDQGLEDECWALAGCGKEEEEEEGEEEKGDLVHLVGNLRNVKKKRVAKNTDMLFSTQYMSSCIHVEKKGERERQRERERERESTSACTLYLLCCKH